MNPWMIIRIVTTAASILHLTMRVLEYKERKEQNKFDDYDNGKHS